MDSNESRVATETKPKGVWEVAAWFMEHTDEIRALVDEIRALVESFLEAWAKSQSGKKEGDV